MPGVFFKSRCVVSMCAVIGYSAGRTSAQPRNVERSAQLLRRRGGGWNGNESERTFQEIRRTPNF